LGVPNLKPLGREGGTGTIGLNLLAPRAEPYSGTFVVFQGDAPDSRPLSGPSVGPVVGIFAGLVIKKFLHTQGDGARRASPRRSKLE